jgi:hypothetical protein
VAQRRDRPLDHVEGLDAVDSGLDGRIEILVAEAGVVETEVSRDTDPSGIEQARIKTGRRTAVLQPDMVQAANSGEGVRPLTMVSPLRRNMP